MSIFKHKHLNPSTKTRVSKKKAKSISLNKKIKTGHKNLSEIITKRYLFITIILVLLFSIIAIRLFKLQIIDYEDYQNKLTVATEKTVEGASAPRGRIYDRNYNLLVDNEAIKTIYYKKQSGITTEEEIALAYKIGAILEVDYQNLSTYRLKNFYYQNNLEKCKSLITKEEKDKYNKRKLNDDDLLNLIFDRITDEDLSAYTEVDKEAAYIYYLMNKGYSYAEKIIKNKNVTEEEYAKISENIDNLQGFNTKLDWVRVYLYGDTFKSTLGTVSSDTQGIPEELASVYLEKGYSLDDRVGISYLEYQYEDYLKGTKPVYKVGKNNNYEIVSYGSRGNDIVLTIDIELQKYLEDTLSEEVMNASNEPNTPYYNRSFAIISNPNTGEILAMSGKQVRTNSSGSKEIVDYTPGIVTLPVTPGSVVKGASMLVGYKYGAINIGDTLKDECIKIKDTPEKCSWRTMGDIDDLYALRYSSNVYQYKIAIKVGEGNYEYNKALKIKEDAFNKYRDMYQSFGLGVKTGIDLPGESVGLLNRPSSWNKADKAAMSYGYGASVTAIQMVAAVAAIANDGVRVTPHVIKYSQEDFEKKIHHVRVMSPEHARTVTDLLRQSVELEKAPLKLNDYYVAAKTGTSHKPKEDGSGYTNNYYTSSIGYLPATNPQVLIYVVVDSAQGGEIWGSTVAAPIFHAVATQVASIMNLIPDKHS